MSTAPGVSRPVSAIASDALMRRLQRLNKLCAELESRAERAEAEATRVEEIATRSKRAGNSNQPPPGARLPWLLGIAGAGAATVAALPSTALAQQGFPDGVSLTGGSVQLAGYPLLNGQSVPIVVSTQQAPWRLFVSGGNDPQGSTDNVLGFVYNCTKNNVKGGWNQPDVLSEPAMQWSLESRWNGNAEWNWDLAGPGSVFPAVRPWGAEYKYATKHCAFSIGNLGPGAGGFWFNGGPQGELVVTSAAGQGGAAPILGLFRGDGSSFMKVNPAAFVMVATSNAVADIGRAGYSGLINLLSTARAFTVGSTSADDVVLQSGIAIAGGTADKYKRFVLRTDGTANWGPGSSPTDAGLKRQSSNRLQVTGSLAVSQLVSTLAGGGRISQGAGAPLIPNQVVPGLGDVYFRTDTPTVRNQRIYVCAVGGSSPQWLGIV